MSAKVELIGRVEHVRAQSRVVLFQMQIEGERYAVRADRELVDRVQLLQKPSDTRWRVTGTLVLQSEELGVLAQTIEEVKHREPELPDGPPQRKPQRNPTTKRSHLPARSTPARTRKLGLPAPFRLGRATQLFLFLAGGSVLALTYQPDVPRPPAYTVSGFSDVPDDNPYAKHIAALRERQVIVGHKDGSFQPEAPITRAELALFLVKAFQVPATEHPVQFADSSGHWGAPYIQAALEAGMISGTSATTFAPDEAVYREQAATMIWRHLQHQGLPATTADVPLHEPISPWAREAVRNIVYYNFVGPLEHTAAGQPYRARDRMTRQEAAALIDKAVKWRNRGEF